MLSALQIGMWERITAALAELQPEALTPGSAEGDGPGEEDPEALVEYEGMLVSAAAAQRRRSEPRQPGWCGTLLEWRPHTCSHCAAASRSERPTVQRCRAQQVQRLGTGWVAARLMQPWHCRTQPQPVGGLPEAVACSSWRSSGSPC